MKELLSVTDSVEVILKADPKTRNCDNLLYIRFLDELSRKEGKVDYLHMTVLNFLDRASELGVPSKETVSRTRRKLQQEHPELKSNVTVSGYRLEREEMFREYARG